MRLRVPVKGYEGLYEADESGEIYSLLTHRFIRAFLNRAGYRIVTLYNRKKAKRFFMQRIIARAFLGDIPEGLQINHKDADKLNNRPSNLEYITAKENMAECARRNPHMWDRTRLLKMSALGVKAWKGMSPEERRWSTKKESP